MLNVVGAKNKVIEAIFTTLHLFETNLLLKKRVFLALVLCNFLTS